MHHDTGVPLSHAPSSFTTPGDHVGDNRQLDPVDSPESQRLPGAATSTSPPTGTPPGGEQRPDSSTLPLPLPTIHPHMHTEQETPELHLPKIGGAGYTVNFWVRVRVRVRPKMGGAGDAVNFWGLGLGV